ncbi:transporter substrate-binding domain-containing protein [Maridesulfovibrio sp.]|uniref:substrate-binding periplasmic protein n=1 Tax=Maridesulfovibrio sp. TaxID=2795000 RepID=UPI002A18E02E|nr:transporter substrate-binding domain-containing protein [Maridesulfovibrio sp.]
MKIRYKLITLITILLLAPQYVFAARQLTFATDPFPPYYYEEDGIPRGLQYELAKIVFDKMHLSFKLIFVPWKRALLMAESGKVDGIFGLRKTEERQRWLIYPEEPLMNVVTVIFKRADDPFEYNGIQSLKGKKVGITKGYTYGSNFDNSTLFEKEQVSSIRHNFLKLLAGRIDLVAGYRAVGVNTMANMNLQERIAICPNNVYTTALYIGFTKVPGYGRISQKFSKELNEFKKSIDCNDFIRKMDIPKEMITPCK